MTSRAQVALLAPMRSELRPLVRKLSLERVGGDGAIVHTGTAGDVPVVATLTGIGMRPAAAAASRILDSHPVEYLVVVGIAGGVPPHTRVGDLVVPEVVVDGVTKREYRPARLGGVEPQGRLESSDEFHVDDEDITRLAGEGVIALDMETAAVAEVCEQRQQPWSVFRAISDMAGETDDAVIGLVNPDGSPNLGAALRYILPQPWKIPGLARLVRDGERASQIAADAAISACGAVATS
jgi:hypothetical protein